MRSSQPALSRKNVDRHRNPKKAHCDYISFLPDQFGVLQQAIQDGLTSDSWQP